MHPGIPPTPPPPEPGRKARGTRWFRHVSRWYARFERPISSASLVGGFVFDALTLRRVDLFWENFWVVAHLLAVAICIFLINLKENSPADPHDPGRLHFWLINILQFFFGGLLSTFLVYYFRAGTIAVSWPFFAILAAAFIANESLKRHYGRLVFQISILFLSILCFAIFIVPVVVHAIGSGVFLLSGGISIAIIALFLILLRFAARERFKKSRGALIASIGAIFIAVNLLYFYNFIPPLPLSLKDAGIYHSLTVNSPGRYTVTEEPQSPWSFLQWYEPIHMALGSPLFAYTAVFSPESFKLNIIHEWQYYSTQKNQWVTVGRIPLSVTGGRDGGYRTFSEEFPSVAGKWRVNVTTATGAVIGRLNFEISATTSPEMLQTTMIN